MLFSYICRLKQYVIYVYMRKISLLLLILPFCLNVNAQKVKKEKHQIKVQQYPLIQLTPALDSYSSNKDQLFFFDVKLSDSPAYTINGESYPALKLNNLWGMKPIESKLNPGTFLVPVSQAVKIQIKDRSGKMIYYRIFNKIFQVVQKDVNSYTSESDGGKTFNSISRYFIKLFEKRLMNIKIKLSNVIKSDQHADLNSAYSKSKKAIEESNKGNYDASEKLLGEAVSIWKKALLEVDCKNKKARINKKLAKAIYQNLIQVMPLIGLGNEMQDLANDYTERIGSSGDWIIRENDYYFQNMIINDLAKQNKGNMLFSDIETPKDISPTKSGDKLNLPASVNDISNVLIGSWRVFYESFKLPQNVQAEKLDRNPKNKCNEQSIMHLDYGGANLFQEGSWQSGCKQEFDDFTPFWKILRRDNGEFYLCFAMDKDGFDSPDNVFKIIHMSEDRLVVEGLTYPDGDTTRESVLQFERIKPKFNNKKW